MDIDFGVGSGCSPGTLWMALSGSWYECSVTGSSGSAALHVNQVPLSLQDNSLGYQLLRANDLNVYQVSLSWSIWEYINVYISISLVQSI